VSIRYVEHNLSYGKIALASFIGYAFSNNIGMATPGGFILPRIMANIASLISGGIKGVIAK